GSAEDRLQKDVQEALVLGHFDETPAASSTRGAKSRKGGDSGVHAGDGVSIRHDRAHWTGVGVTRNRRDAAVRLQVQTEGNPIAHRPRIAKAGHGHHNDAWIAFSYVVVRDSKVHQDAGSVVLDEHIRPLDEVEEDLPPADGREVEHEALLVAGVLLKVASTVPRLGAR